MAKLTWILQSSDGEIFCTSGETRPATGKRRVIGIKVGHMRALLEAGEQRDQERADPQGKAGVRGIIVKDCQK